MLAEETDPTPLKASGQVPVRVVTCPTCAGPADVHSRHMLLDRSGVRLFCSPACRERAIAGDPKPEPAPGPARRPRKLVVGGVLVGCLFVSDSPAIEEPPPPPAQAAVFIPPPPVVVVPMPPPKPSEEELLRRQWMTELMKDAWVHPLPGPRRRMPIRDSRVFGAERPGDRPIECANGHCGVDIGGEVWGEPVLAAHDGVVARVQRGPNEDRGGLYVRLAHRDGTVFTQYFHLAAIPRWMRVGREVQAGEVIGLVGDTGVKESGPHLHFTISIRPAEDQPERYIDPEPLIALWPLHDPDNGKISAADEPPGMVRGALSRRSRRRPSQARLQPAPVAEAAPAAEPDPEPDPASTL